MKGLELIAADIGSGIKQPAQAIKVSRADVREPGSRTWRRLQACGRSRIRQPDCRRPLRRSQKIRGSTARSLLRNCNHGQTLSGEIISGDDGGFVQSESQLLAAVADGLGHGPEAREASNRAIDAVVEQARPES